MTWEKKAVTHQELTKTAEEFNVDTLSATVLLRRGYHDAETIRYILDNDLSMLHNPFLFKDMDSAITRLRKARREGECVCVFGDRDADGITSTTLMVETLKNFGIEEVAWKIPEKHDIYGLTVEAIEEFVQKNCTLILTVDCGITCYDEMKAAHAHGIDVIVIDHHNPQEYLPEADVIINPKLIDSPYPFKELCGCAVVHKLRWALRYAEESPWYNRAQLLLHARPIAGNVMRFEFVHMQNGIEHSAIEYEDINPFTIKFTVTKLYRYAQNCRIICYDDKAVLDALHAAFKFEYEIELVSLPHEMEQSGIYAQFPQLRGKSLLQLWHDRHKNESASEIKEFIHLFKLYDFYSHTKTVHDIRSALDLVMLGTLADVQPMHNENRILVKYGMEELVGTKRPGLQAMLHLMRNGYWYGEKLTVRDVNFRIIPTINSMGKLGHSDVALRLLMSTDLEEAHKTALEANKINKKRQQIGNQSFEMLLPHARKSFEKMGGEIVLVWGEDIVQGITGMLASKLCDIFHTSVIVIAVSGTQCIGSIRCQKEFQATKFFGLFDDILEKWGGHDCAAGFQLQRENLSLFETRICEMIKTYNQPTSTITIPIDIEFKDKKIIKQYFNPNLFDLVERFEPYGNEHPPILFVIRNIRIGTISFFGAQDAHVKLLIDSGSHKWPAIYWNKAEEVGPRFNEGDHVDILFELEKNQYKGISTPRIKVCDMHKSEN